MPRSLSAGFEAAIALERSELVHLIQLEYSGGTLYLTTASGDITWDSKTFQAVGGTLAWDEVVEMPDRRSEGVRVVMSGVDGSIVSTLLSNHFRGRLARIHIAHLDPDDGSLVSDPLLVFHGHQSGQYSVRETRDTEGLGPGTVDIETRVVSRMAALERTNEVRTNPTSHRAMLKRGGFTGGDLDDGFFKRVASLVGEPIYWGTAAPVSFRGRGGGGDDGRRERD